MAHNERAQEMGKGLWRGDQRAIGEALRYVKRNGRTLRTAYGARCIAVMGEVVVGYHINEDLLAAELERKFPHQFLIIGTIDDLLDHPSKNVGARQEEQT